MRPGRANLRPQWSTGGMDGRTEGQTSGNSPLCSTGHRLFGAAAQIVETKKEKKKEKKKELFMIMRKGSACTHNSIDPIQTFLSPVGLY